MADASPVADGASSAAHEDAAEHWDGALGVQHSREANGETPRADSPRFRSYLVDNASDGGSEQRDEMDGTAVDGGGWDAEHGVVGSENDPREDGGPVLRYEEEEKRAHEYEEGDEDEDDDWMVAHLATLETKRRASTSIQEVEASVRAALSILNQSSDGAGTSQHDDDDDDERGEDEHREEGEWRRYNGRPHYFDFVQEAMEARWSLGSPNQNLLNEEGEHAFRPGVHEIQESDEDDDEADNQGEQEERADAGAVMNSNSAVAAASGASSISDGVRVEAEEDAGNAKPLDNEPDGNQADDEWQEAYTAKGRVYYYNRRTRESSWNKPAKYRASARPQSPEAENGAPHRVVARQSLGYHASNNDSPRSLADQRQLFCCFCGSKHEPRQFQVHFRECKSLNFHKKQSSELYRGFQRILTVLSEDSSLRALHYASSFPDAQPVPLSSSMQDNLLLLRRHQSTQRSQSSTTAKRRPETMRSATRADRDSRTRTTGPVALSKPQQLQQKKQSRPARNGSTPTSSAGARAKFSGGFPLEVETCRYCGRSFAEGRLAKHEAVCPRVFGNEGSWGRGTPSSANTATGSSAGQPTTSPASKRRGMAHRKLKTAKLLTDAHTLEASYKEHQAALVVCPCCKRKFAPSGAQQHIAICKSVQNRPKNPIPLLKDFATAG